MTLEASDLIPAVYDELRRLAAARLATERPGQTLQATALVNEAYLRLAGQYGGPTFATRQQFFAAAAEAMRRILIDRARYKQSQRHGGQLIPCDESVERLAIVQTTDPAEALALDEVLGRLKERYPRKAEVVHLRYFLGCTFREIADILHCSADTAEEDWTFARAWLHREWQRGENS